MFMRKVINLYCYKMSFYVFVGSKRACKIYGLIFCLINFHHKSYTDLSQTSIFWASKRIALKKPIGLKVIQKMITNVFKDLSCTPRTAFLHFALSCFVYSRISRWEITRNIFLFFVRSSIFKVLFLYNSESRMDEFLL